MRQERFTLSAKELQRVAVISHCVKGDLACAGAAELLDRPPRQVKRLKLRYRQGGEAAMAHASRGRPVPVASRNRCARASCAWLAPAIAASTITISAKSSPRSRAFPSAGKPSVVCSAAKAWALGGAPLPRPAPAPALQLRGRQGPALSRGDTPIEHTTP